MENNKTTFFTKAKLFFIKVFVENTPKSKNVLIVRGVLFILVSIFLLQLFLFRKPPYDELAKLLDQKKYEEVIKGGEYYLARNSDDSKLKILLARSYVAYGAIVHDTVTYGKKAVDLLETIDEESVQVLAAKGYVYSSLHNYVKARLAYEQASLLDPKNVDIIVKIAECYVNDKDYTKAYPLYKKATTLDPHNLNALIGFLRVRVFYGQYEYVRKEAMYWVTRTKNKNYLADLNQILGTEYARAKDFDNAEKSFEVAVLENPTNTNALIGLADSMVKNISKRLSVDGNTIISLTEKPEELIKKALSYNDNNIYAYLVLLDIARIRGDKVKEGEYVKRVKELQKTTRLLQSEIDLIASRLALPSLVKVKFTKDSSKTFTTNLKNK